MAFIVIEGAENTKFVGDDKFGPLVGHVSKLSGVGINSHARDQEAAAQLHSIGLHTQAEVIQKHANGEPGYGPANPVDRTTHCRRNDGVAFPHLPAGAQLEPWERGIDTRNSPAFCNEARQLGFVVTLTYPHSAGEAQHVNFRTDPHYTAPPHTLKEGDTGPLVVRLTHILSVLRRPSLNVKYLDHSHVHFSKSVQTALEQFQRDHHQHPDGVCGAHTWAQLEVSLHFAQAHHQA
jgi:hypothetical protein